MKYPCRPSPAIPGVHMALCGWSKPNEASQAGRALGYHRKEAEVDLTEAERGILLYEHLGCSIVVDAGLTGCMGSKTTS